MTMTKEPDATETSSDESAPDYFRCPVQEDQGAATIQVGWRKIDVTVQETSIDGFTILVPPSAAGRLNVSKPWVLVFDGGRYEVHGQWFFHAPDGHVQVGMRRLRDLTTAQVQYRRSGFFNAVGLRNDSADSSTIAFAGFVLVLICAMALPGLGDTLGTVEPMGAAFKSAFGGIGDVIRSNF